MEYSPLEDAIGMIFLEYSDRTIYQYERLECTILPEIGAMFPTQRDVIVTTGTINSPIEIPPC